MLFNSHIFIFGFLPASLVFFYVVRTNVGPEWAVATLVASSVFFYGFWNPQYVLLLSGSIAVNFSVGQRLMARRADRQSGSWLLWAGIAANLLTIAYFKYANFFVDSVSLVAGASWKLAPITLLLAISFFAFQQIAYLVDTHRGDVRGGGFLRYCLFVSFFPQLIAGPIVHHREMMPQFARAFCEKFRAKNLAVGLTIFMVGLFKKVLFADGIAGYSDVVFAEGSDGAFRVVRRPS